MLTTRIIPCLDVKDGRVVKGKSFVELCDAGDPVELASFYYKEGADELVFLDIMATPDGRDTMVDVVERISEKVFIPLTVGGGLRSISDMRRMLLAGADKVSINTAAVLSPALIRESADGHRAGYDTQLTRAVSEAVSVPVIASGGAGTPEDLYQALVSGKADAVLAASIFHYATYSINEVKEYLAKWGIPIRA